MGQTSHLAPESFAGHLNAYLWHLIEPKGAEKSGRWLESATAGARKKDYWSEILKNKKSMTTNDIQVVAEVVLGISPYQFVRDARDWDASEDSRDTHLGEVIDGGFGQNAKPEEKAPKQLDAAASKRSRDRGEDDGYDG